MPNLALDQPAPVVALGEDGQEAADAQIRFSNEWTAGDRILFQVRDSAGDNCANVAETIYYADAPTVEVLPQHYELSIPGDSPFSRNVFNGGVELIFSDLPVASTAPPLRPSSTSA